MREVWRKGGKRKREGGKEGGREGERDERVKSSVIENTHTQTESTTLK